MKDTSLQQQILELQAQLALLQETSTNIINAQKTEIEALKIENKLLRGKLDAFIRRYFGKKSEVLSTAQLELLLAGLESAPAASAPESSPAPADSSAPKGKRNGTTQVRTPDNLEVVQKVIQPDVVESQPDQWKQIAQEVTRQLDYQPGKFFWLETIRPKYVKKDQKELAPVLAPAPERASGMAAPGLLAYLLVSKFSDHLPFYRQQSIFQERHGVYIARQQMVLWMKQGVTLLEGIVTCIKEDLRKSSYAQVDETPVKYLDPGMGKCSQGYLWTAHVPKVCVVFEWHASRAATCLNSLLGEGFRGKIQCDGYSAYPAFAKDKPEIELYACWAHGRRGIFQAQKEAPRLAGWILKQIDWLYQWEAQLREGRAGPEARAAMRASHHRMVVKRLHRVLGKTKSRFLPKSGMGEAMGYILNQWDGLARIMETGVVELDQNLVENKIRPTAVGKRNWLFFGAEQAGERNAVVYTLIANCRMHGIEPLAYLKDVLTRLPSTTNQQVAELTPRQWKQSRRKAADQAA